MQSRATKKVSRPFPAQRVEEKPLAPSHRESNLKTTQFKENMDSNRPQETVYKVKINLRK